MTIWLTVVAWILAGAAAVPLAVLAIELLAGLWPGSRPAPRLTNAPAVVLIPAHDEAQGIGSTLASLFAVAPPGTRVVVIADNCSDATAMIAREAGAEVIERRDDLLRGKGYALSAGRDYLAAANPPSAGVVIVMDADCRLLPGSIEALVAGALAHDAPVQAINLIEPDRSAAPMVQVSSFAMLVKNLYRSRGMQRLGGAALLTGTGMAFPWPLIANARLATGSIVEDLALGIEFTEAGAAPRLIESAGVRSAPAALGDALAQKTRWEHGFLQTLRSRAVPLVARGMVRGSPALMLLGLHLMVPPLALLLVVAAAVLALLLVLGLTAVSMAPALVLGGMMLVVLLLVSIAWVTGGRAYLSGPAVLRAPLYLAWKLPVYARFLKRPQADWNRTPRRPH